MDLYAHNSHCNAPAPAARKRRFKPICEIVRDGAGRPLGRVLRLERETVAYTYAGLQPIGRFESERAGRSAIRKASARR